MISPDDVQSPYSHGQLYPQALVGLWLIWIVTYGIGRYIQAANRARLADKAKKRARNGRRPQR